MASTSMEPKPGLGWLDSATQSRMDRAIARERSLSAVLMTYIVSGLIFMLLPGTFLGVWNLVSISCSPCCWGPVAYYWDCSCNCVRASGGLCAEIRLRSRIPSIRSISSFWPGDFWCRSFGASAHAGSRFSWDCAPRVSASYLRRLSWILWASPRRFSRLCRSRQFYFRWRHLLRVGFALL
jgi:hypothetical protein